MFLCESACVPNASVAASAAPCEPRSEHIPGWGIVFISTAVYLCLGTLLSWVTNYSAMLNADRNPITKKLFIFGLLLVWPFVSNFQVLSAFMQRYLIKNQNAENNATKTTPQATPLGAAAALEDQLVQTIRQAYYFKSISASNAPRSGGR
ncbi:hypothetical protein B0T20DRAFT_394101 [Sordaria brevicollis]|uniref:Uncharacterized protein n=1 Tax=Sordaria brevicollis TaxID=83679 RepID=A0AAE0UAE7_SORBR|nr:hypothetical protein B0T20DRAFT_394101 [Sordaria brevicollis]